MNNPRQCDFNVVLNRAIEKLKPVIKDSGVVVTFGPMPSLNADSPSMVVVLGNLISNAIEFRDRKPSRVHISAQCEDEEWIFSVTDNGIGFPTADDEHIFGMPERSGSSSDLGLAICKKIIENHGGRTWVESEPGMGTTFYFSLPK